MSYKTREADLAVQTGANAPVPFIVGTGRCGSTLLRLMLDAHRQDFEHIAGDLLRGLGYEVDVSAGCRRPPPVWIEQVDRARQELVRLIPPARSFILVDQDEWGGCDLGQGRKSVPFLSRDGQYWGPPPNDEVAIRAVEEIRSQGASHLVFAWPAFWWLDHYTEWRQRLLTAFPCVLRNERLIAFELDPELGTARAGSAEATWAEEAEMERSVT